MRSFREEHTQQAAELDAEHMRAKLQMGRFDEDGDEIDSDEEWDDGDVQVKEIHDVESGNKGCLAVRLHLEYESSKALTVQANRPLAGTMPEVEQHVYFEVKIELIDPEARLCIGWATLPHPPFVLPGHGGSAAHAVVLESGGEHHTLANVRTVTQLDEDDFGRALDTKVAPTPSAGGGHTPSPSGPAIARTTTKRHYRSKGKVAFKRSDDSTGGVLLEQDFLRDGDVVGCGYKQLAYPPANGVGPHRLMIQFYFRVNGLILEIPEEDSTMAAINSVWDAEHATRILDRGAEHARCGILANGCAVPTIGATGPFSGIVRFKPPFETFRSGTLSNYQVRYVPRRRSVARAKEIRKEEKEEQAKARSKAQQTAEAKKMRGMHHRDHHVEDNRIAKQGSSRRGGAVAGFGTGARGKEFQVGAGAGHAMSATARQMAAEALLAAGDSDEEDPAGFLNTGSSPVYLGSGSPSVRPGGATPSGGSGRAWLAATQAKSARNMSTRALQTHADAVALKAAAKGLAYANTVQTRRRSVVEKAMMREVEEV